MFRFSPASNYLPSEAITTFRLAAPAPPPQIRIEWPEPAPITYGQTVGARAFCARVVPPMPGTLLYYVPDYQSPAADHVAAPLYALAATAEVRVVK